MAVSFPRSSVVSPHIRHFVLHQYGPRGRLDFSAITGDCGSAIRGLCRSPNLVSLDLDRIRRLPITVISTCPNLRCLRVFAYYIFCKSQFWMLSAPTNLVFQLLDDVDSPSCLPPFSLDTIDIDRESMCSLGSGGIIPSAKYFLGNQVSRTPKSILQSRGVDGLSCFWPHKTLQHFLFSASAMDVNVSFPFIAAVIYWC